MSESSDRAQWEILCLLRGPCTEGGWIELRLIYKSTALAISTSTYWAILLAFQSLLVPHCPQHLLGTSMV